MGKFLGKIAVGVIVSMFLFPFGFTFLPSGINVKMILAVLGAALCVFDCLSKREVVVTKGFFGAAFLATVFSLACFFAVDYNGTTDYSYATYISSFFTWAGSAYAVCRAIKWLHGEANIRNLTYYLAGVSLAQCILAILIDTYPGVKNLVDRYIAQGAEFMDEVNRLYGIGAALDPAGTRFAVTLILIIGVLVFDAEVRQKPKVMIQLLVSYFLIILMGNMISRTTSVGVMLSLPLALIGGQMLRLYITSSFAKFYGVFLLILTIVAVVAVYLYNTDPLFKADMRFAFEGFFNWVETGTWSTGSTDKLNREMWVWPETTEAWIVGTGIYEGFVYGTDIGYCRFILYCGLLGFSVFALLQIYNGLYFAIKEKEYRLMFFCMILFSFVIWVKVSTDIFQFYALLYCLDTIKPTPKHENYLYHSSNL